MILDAVNADYSSFHGLALALIAFTGARSNEILKLTSQSIEIIDEENVRIKIKASKLGKDRSITMPTECYARIKDLLAKMNERGSNLATLINDSSLSFQAAYVSLKQYFYKLQRNLFGVVLYSLHSFRHSIAMRAIQGGWDIVRVKSMLGHKHISSTQRYLAEYELSIDLNNVHKLVRSS